MNVLNFTAYFGLFLSCFFNGSCPAAQESQEPNTINFDDIFYLETFKASVYKEDLTKSGEIPSYIKTLVQNSLNDEAKSARQKYSSMVSQWADPNLPPSDYQIAALTILVHLELNEKKLLTFGTVVNIFGIPDIVYFSGYCSDNLGTMASNERFCAIYKQKDIGFRFSVTGFCRGIYIYSSTVNTRGVKRWPQKYSYSEQIPILYNFTPEDSLYKNLCEEIENMKHEKYSFYSWIAYMQRWSKDYKVPDAEYNLDITMVDHALDNLAIAYLKISGNKETLYCDTWWKYQLDRWILLNDEQVTQYFTNGVEN